jgi:multiple sugar transport system permease protein
MARAKDTSWKSPLNTERQAWAFASPGLLLLLLFVAIPFAMAFVLAFTDQRLVPNRNLPTEFVGLKNFVDLFDDEIFWRALLNNFLFTAIVVPLQTAFAMLLAVLVNTRKTSDPRETRLLNLFRTIFFSPVATTMVVVSVIWVLLYDASPEGTINRIVTGLTFGLVSPQQWLQNPWTALPAIMLMSIWQGVGFQMVTYLAGLQDIPDEVYEAANLDGASAVRTFFDITVPMLKNTTIAVVITTTILAFQLFGQVQIMTRGGPLDATQTVIYHTKVMGFEQGKIGYASAITIVFFAIVVIVSLIQRAFLREDRAIN